MKKVITLLTHPYLVIPFGGLFLLVWIFSISPSLLQYPQNFSYEADIDSTDNLYNETLGDFSGPVHSVTQFLFQSKNTDGQYQTIRNSFDVHTPTGQTIFSIERLYGIDRRTGAHASGYGDRDREGYLFAPRNLQKQNFTYWHINYDQPLEMRFQSEEEILGLKTYRYTSVFTADQTKELTRLPEVGVTKGINVDVSLVLWIEPVTGRLVKYEDTATAYYYDLADHKRLFPWNEFHNEYLESSVVASVRSAEAQKQKSYLITFGVPAIVFFLILSVVLLRIPFAFKVKVKDYYFVPAMLFFLIVGFSVAVWYYMSQFVHQEQQFRFNTEVGEIKSLILNRLHVYESALISGESLFASSDFVTRSEWKTFSEKLSLQSNYPGVQGIGYAQVIQPQDLEAYLEGVRAEGFPEFKMNPEGERNIYTSIKYLEPFDERNKRAFGYDMFSNDVRRLAMQVARDTGRTSISGKVILLQETDTDVQPGFLMYVPFYGKGNNPQTVEERRVAVQGYIYSPFRFKNLMQGIFENRTYNINFEIADGSVDGDFPKDQVLFDYGGEQISHDSNFVPVFSQTQKLDVYGRVWTVRFDSLPNFESSLIERSYPTVFLGVGLILAIAFASLAFVTMRQRDYESSSRQAQLRAMVASMPYGVVILDANDRISILNKKFLEMFSITETPESFENQNYSALSFYEEKVFRRGKEEVQALAGILQKRAPVLNGKIEIRGDKYYKQSYAPLFLGQYGERVLGGVWIFQDVTEEENIAKMKTTFVSLVSHQLKTPAAEIKGYVSNMLDGLTGKLNEKQLDYLKDMYTVADANAQLVDDLLNVSRLDRGVLVFSVEPVLTAEVIREATKPLEQRARAAAVKLQTDTQDLWIMADKLKLVEALRNLVDNAIKFTLSEKSVEVKVESAGEWVKIIVQDEGRGIESEVIEEVLIKNHVWSGAAKAGGSGLGLYLAKNFIEGMGGTLSCEQTHPGTKFTIVIKSGV